MERKLIGKFDIFIALLLVSFCLLLLFLPREANSLTAEIISENKTEIIELEKVSEPYEMTVTSNGHTLILNVSRDGVEIIKTDCKDKVCASVGKVSRHNECAICLPAKVIVRVYEKDGEETVDGLI